VSHSKRPELEPLKVAALPNSRFEGGSRRGLRGDVLFRRPTRHHHRGTSPRTPLRKGELDQKEVLPALLSLMPLCNNRLPDESPTQFSSFEPLLLNLAGLSLGVMQRLFSNGAKIHFARAKERNLLNTEIGVRTGKPEVGESRACQMRLDLFEFFI